MRTALRICSIALALSSGLGCSTSETRDRPAAEASAGEERFKGLGSHSLEITTRSSEAQAYFDQGLAFVNGFNHDEAIRSFRRAAELDPGCAMAWWGIAYANGPHINNPAVDEAHAKAAWQALNMARAAAANAAGIERALIDALGNRYADPQPEDRKPLNQAYADAMREVWKRYPSNPDAGALFAEAMMDLRPWDLWTPDGEPQPGTVEIVATLEAVIDMAPDHPLANHLYIHAIEASPHPEKAAASADRLRDLQPGLGHMVHMPSHIDVRLGHWSEAIAANERAIEADKAYRERVSGQNFYRVYMAHNRHMLTFAAMMEGRSQMAIDAMRAAFDEIPEEWLRENAALADGYVAMPLEVLMRFGRWQELLAAPDLPDYLPLARAMRHYARTTALAATARLDEAREEQRLFRDAASAVPEAAAFGNNPARDLLAVADHMSAGELLVAEGKVDEGLAELREAVKREDALRYDEPPDWIIPVRHALGAALLRAGRSAEAEQVYRDDLKKLPENGWSLYGLGRSLRLQGKDGEAAVVESRFQKVWRNADVKLESSCFCQKGI